MNLQSLLTVEFQRRTRRNPRYSMRAFARSLALHHTTVLRLVHGTRRPSARLVMRLARHLDLSPDELSSLLQREAADRVIAAAQLPDFRADCRWIAMKTGLELDEVNRTLHWLIHERRLVMSTPSTWTIISS